LIADLSGRLDAVDDVEDVRFRTRAARAADGGGDVDVRVPGVDKASSCESEGTSG
jgi:hypothetical protein